MWHVGPIYFSDCLAFTIAVLFFGTAWTLVFRKRREEKEADKLKDSEIIAKIRAANGEALKEAIAEELLDLQQGTHYDALFRHDFRRGLIEVLRRLDPENDD